VIFTTVRQHPFTATLSPSFKPMAQRRASMVSSMDFRAGLMALTTPVSSTMPVNIGGIYDLRFMIYDFKKLPQSELRRGHAPTSWTAALSRRPFNWMK
jgi:hypothetical protein